MLDSVELTADSPLTSSIDSPQAYLCMKTSISLFELNPDQLSQKQVAELQRVVSKSFHIQQKVLASKEAKLVHVDDAQLNKGLALIKQNFESPEAFNKALLANQLSEPGLRDALRLELSCEAVLAYVSKNVAPVSEAQALAFYQQYPEKFLQVERRAAHHILITVNEQFKENAPTQAKSRIYQLAKQVNSDNFEQLAERHSECPTAVSGGKLGLVARDQLLPQLDEALFNMDQASFSQPIFTGMGYHLLWCKQIMAEHKIPFEEAKTKIEEALLGQAQKQQQRQWLVETCKGSSLN
ncbi:MULTISPECIES: nitrogen fixation protein NifM [unclassified Agarivorans]|uniref:nitrogen fixation protein NifM n=1 Tax=unclassified Agarivorans TaxID=2636026 RepID=UPI0026E47E52|nr:MULTISPECIES: nitrogen fixation protein NifM [unclassified Agarivorans]MDO6685956.1 nitrogen fixation protein NifM [Agarivorans sp. 3_MG-2023]MDO6713906.1 nitrogen fixation protein NifM [Agarivorans sp. 2_MG-2023]